MPRTTESSWARPSLQRYLMASRGNFDWLALLALSCAAAVAFGFNLAPKLTPVVRVGIVRDYAIYPLAMAFAGILWATLRQAFVNRGALRHVGPGLRRRYLAYGVLVVSAAAYLTTREPNGWLVVDDEIVNATSATHMTRTTESFKPWTIDYGPMSQPPSYKRVTGFVDKRPATQPFLASVRNWVFGFDPYSINFVNIACVWLTCLLLACLIAPSAGVAGVAVALLFYCAVPLASHLACSGDSGPPLVALALMAALWSRSWLQHRSSTNLTGLVCTAILLCYTRYEAALAVLPIAAIIAWGWWREGRPKFNAWLVLFPLSLVFVPLRNDVFTVIPQLKQLGHLGRTEQFSRDYVAFNLQDWIQFYFVPAGGNPANPLLSALIAGALAYWLLKSMFNRSQPLPITTDGLWMMTLVSFSAPLLFYYWGDLTDPFVWRLSLPVWAAACWFTGAYLVPRLARDRTRWFFMALGAIAVFYGAIITHELSYRQRYTTAPQGQWLDLQLRELMLTPNWRNITVVTHEQSRVNPFHLAAIDYEEVRRNPQVLRSLIQSGREVWWYNEYFLVDGSEYLIGYMDIPREFTGDVRCASPTAPSIISKFTRLTKFDSQQPARALIAGEVRGAMQGAFLEKKPFDPVPFIQHRGPPLAVAHTGLK